MKIYMVSLLHRATITSCHCSYVTELARRSLTLILVHHTKLEVKPTVLPRPARISHTVHLQNLSLLGLVGLLSRVSGVRVRIRVSVRIGVRFSFSANCFTRPVAVW